MAEITDFDSSMVRYGKGALGGKGRGFRFLHNLSDKFNMSTVFPELELVVPRCFILATEVFDRFIADNKLMVPALNATTNEEVREMFPAATLPPADAAQRISSRLIGSWVAPRSGAAVSSARTTSEAAHRITELRRERSACRRGAGGRPRAPALRPPPTPG
mgnify:CR=1 FL=1